MELHGFILHKCMFLRLFGAEIVDHPVSKIFKKSFLRYFMRAAAFQVTKMYKMYSCKKSKNTSCFFRAFCPLLC